jgi:hypothetical protein
MFATGIVIIAVGFLTVDVLPHAALFLLVPTGALIAFIGLVL